ncbi:MAG: lysophospholipid acyltransferase family protein [Elusimicrobiota bacterium]
MLYKILVIIGIFYIRILGWTTDFKYYNLAPLPDPPYILAFWHSRLMFLVYSHRGRGINVLVSRSRDGGVISKVIHNFGFGTVRGSSSRGASASAIGLIKLLKRKKVCAITPDGPKGPREKVKEGLPAIAKKTGCPVVPLAYAVKSRTLLDTWDNFVLPWPFNKGVVVSGRPVKPDREEELENFKKRIEKGIKKTTQKAEILKEEL